MAEFTAGKIVPVSLTEEMKSSYIDYAMSVNVARAFPDVRDGLKPVQRRILYAMRMLGLLPNRPHKKAATVVGEVLGKYHPHGDQSVYDAAVRMAQDFNMRYPLVDGHGNFGSIDGDPPAQMRYTETRLTRLAMELMRDIDKETVEFVPNYDENEEEPLYLPARFPNLLVNGSSGIGVGIASNIPPHHLGEIVDAINAIIDDPALSDDELMEIVQGPDFPTGALVVGRAPIKEAYTTGRGIITLRARAQIEPIKGNRHRILITEIPYQVNKSKLIEDIADLVREKTIEGITDLRDESDRKGLRMVIELSRNAEPNVTLNKLYKHTQLQTSFGIILLALVDGEPRLLTLREMLEHYVDHQRSVVVRRTRYELAKAEARAHILEGLRIALDAIDDIIELIRGSQDAGEARSGLMEAFELSELQAQAILDMRLQRLTGLERDKIEDEYQGLLKDIEYYRAVLSSERMVDAIVKEELGSVREIFVDERRTQIVSGGAGDFTVEDLIPEEDVAITMSHQGYVKRHPITTYRRQHRGGRGVTGMKTKEEDFVEHMFITTTHHNMLFFSNKGQVYQLKAYEIPEGRRQSRGTAVVNLIEIGKDEQITAVIPVREFNEGTYLTMSTRRGMVKKSDLVEYSHILRSGIIAISLDDEDELIGVELTDGNAEFLLVTRMGQAIRFPEDEVRSMGRNTKGVIGVRLEGDDDVIAMEVVDEDGDLLVVSENGFGKRTAFREYRPQRRAGKGLRTMQVSKRNGPLVGAKAVKAGNEVMLISAKGIIIRMPVDGISRLGRNTQGVTLMRLEAGDRVVAVARVAERQDQELPDNGDDEDGDDGES